MRASERLRRDLRRCCLSSAAAAAEATRGKEEEALRACKEALVAVVCGELGGGVRGDADDVDAVSLPEGESALLAVYLGGLGVERGAA